MNSDDVVEKTNNEYKETERTIPAVDSPAMATRGKRGHK
jgi:hypothetical protein